MKSEFILAFNEICEQRGLPKDEVFEALKTALVSAYRRDTNISAQQRVSVDIDPRTGEPTIYTEKEVVDSIIDNRTEVLLEQAKKEGHTEAEYGDLVMVDSTTSSFGRIAAQTAKQVLLQRVREAEREQLYEDFSGREGELVNGTVQSVSGQHLTIGLGRTEAILPKSQQVQGERYRAHDKIRVYVLEVRRTNRGPQIFVSRNHRNLLRRLLELEVPEIYNGQVEIKSIAREAGQRSKVAVLALQPGVDPVGACVGMRGVRIQSIVRELNDEKIDVIEWDPNQHTFIAKALSPARVSHVFLEESFTDGKTAVVIVPDDQLSLAIGREGQNARLGAKLTGWRIDIKSLTEAASESLDNLDHPAADKAVVGNEKLIDSVKQVLAKKEAGRPITSEDYYNLDRLVGGVEGKIIAARAAIYEEERKARVEARKSIPEQAWELDLEELDLPGRIHNLLLDAEIETVGALMMTLSLGEDAFLNIKGLGDKALEVVKEHLANFEGLPEEPEVEVAEAEPEVVEGAVEEETTAEVEAEVEAAVDTVEEVETEEEATVEVETVDETEAEVAIEEDDESEEEPEPLIDDLSQSLIEAAPIEAPQKPKKEKKKPAVVIARPTTTPEPETEDDRRRSRKGKQLVLDEESGEVVVKRKRKGSRRRPEWEEYDIDDF
ncbi:MAG: transcription termination/antitermination protein NusA [Ardenticatenaceae bacterium]|nr:transcription termination/antitermination protein NusA [Anaerolineales bacterium]MCB8938347.1 transcription termination/antitermination protein NusA [Ardenticatenaceae bacterium]MCB8975346.1 transcription termination/antitermination protein NusA [Ardenticatenaceae bacterium]